jgi:hypothetical protein
VSSDGKGATDQAVIFFNDKELFRLVDKGPNDSIKARSQPCMRQLNQLWREANPVVLTLRTNAGKMRLEVGDALIVEVLPGDTHGADPVLVAQHWAEAIATVFRNGGKSLQVRYEEPPQ